ncbi:MAG TPA: hypothetical protein VFG11_01650 [Acidobacteriota bacterium]|nr:hypothetical protein [Acidobacteriota bacterium]
MRVLSSLILFFLIATQLSAFTVVLKSGRTVEGTLIAEDSVTIQLRDPAGTVLSFRKSTLDLQATTEANHTKSAAPASTGTVQVKPRSLPELAAQVRATRNPRIRVLTNADVDRTAPLAILTSSEEPDYSGIPEPVSVQPKEIESWLKKIASLHKQIDLLLEKQSVASAACEQSKNGLPISRPRKSHGVMVLDPLAPSGDCERLEVIRRQVEDAQARLADIQDQARKRGIPWSRLE